MKEKVTAVKLIQSFKEPMNISLSSDSLSTIRIIESAKTGNYYCDTSIYDKAEQEYIGYRVLKSYYNFNKEKNTPKWVIQTKRSMIHI